MIDARRAGRPADACRAGLDEAASQADCSCRAGQGCERRGQPAPSAGSDPSATDTPPIPLAARCATISRGCRQSHGDDEAERPKIGHQLAHPRLRQFGRQLEHLEDQSACRLPGQPAALLHERFAPAHVGERRVRTSTTSPGTRAPGKPRTIRAACFRLHSSSCARRQSSLPGRTRSMAQSVGRDQVACADSGSVGTEVAAARSCLPTASALSRRVRSPIAATRVRSVSALVTPSSPASRSRRASCGHGSQHRRGSCRTSVRWPPRPAARHDAPDLGARRRFAARSGNPRRPRGDRSPGPSCAPRSRRSRPHPARAGPASGCRGAGAAGSDRRSAGCRAAWRSGWARNAEPAAARETIRGVAALGRAEVGSGDGRAVEHDGLPVRAATIVAAAVIEVTPRPNGVDAGLTLWCRPGCVRSARLYSPAAT